MLRPRLWRLPIVARDHSESHRQATWLELLFDLAFVVAVAQAAIQFEHALAEGHPGSGLIGYLIVFAAIWWAWMAFTWFANVFDNDDVPYRLLMFVMIAGSLGLAAGVSDIAQMDFRIGVLSYVIMRLAYVGQWLRVLRAGDPAWRSLARKMIVLITTVQAGWVAFLWVPADWHLAGFVVWFAVDLAVPYVAGWDARAGGHRHHIIERYGLFTIIVIGETFAAATTAISEAIEAQVAVGPLLLLALGGLVIVFSVWWIYFDFSSGIVLDRGRRAQYFWAYMHYFVFAAIAMVGAGIALAVAWITDPAHVESNSTAVALVPCGAVAALLASLTIIEAVCSDRYGTRRSVMKTLVIALIIGCALISNVVTVPVGLLLAGVVLATFVAVGVLEQHRLASAGADERRSS